MNYTLALAAGLAITGITAATTPSLGQGTYQLKNATVHFFSRAPLSNIEASNEDIKGIVDFTAGTFTFRIPVKSFQFKKTLMQEHFNENYLESDTYPYSTFKGNLEGSYEPGKDGTYPAKAVGALTIHGVTQPRTIPCLITVKNGRIHIASDFIVKLADHHIDIPTLVFNKIAEEVAVKVAGELEAMK